MKGNYKSFKSNFWERKSIKTKVIGLVSLIKCMKESLNQSTKECRKPILREGWVVVLSWQLCLKSCKKNNAFLNIKKLTVLYTTDSSKQSLQLIF